MEKRASDGREFAALGYLWAAPVTLLAIGIGFLLGAKFQRVQGVVEMNGLRVAAILTRLPNPAWAMTLGHAVFGQNRTALDRTRRHEHVHVHQYARWGVFFVPVYLAFSCWLYCRGRDGYRENPFEIEAFAVDDPSRSVSRHERVSS